MTVRAIRQALTEYQSALAPWLQEETVDAQKVLAVLKARDALHTALSQHPTPGIYTLEDIQGLDQQLKKQAARMADLLDFEAYRQSFPKASGQWWWSLDELGGDPRDRYDWLFKGLTIGGWTLSLALLVDISGRFLLGGAGVAGLSAVALSSLLTLIKARNDLSEASRQGFERVLAKFFPGYWHEKVKFASTTVLAAALFAFWLALPAISIRYNQRGQLAQIEGNLGAAEQNYNLAISLNPDNVNAHYNLGTLYEDIQELEKAETQYLIAIRGGLPEAYNNLARLYLQPPKPNLPKAIVLLNQGLKLADDQESFPEVLYTLYKNLGWARLQQARYSEAESALATAVAISEKPDAQYITHPASAHCLLAQTLDAQEQLGSIQAWQRCCQLGDSANPDEDAWLLQARDRLAKAGFDFNQSCQATAIAIP
ncbi:MAG: tetratricopeptide repeat protein [Pseudanabaenales cyanobacterium]|nr:tetratricopeptide repeat protein [Pseudanabaenales cyanobacterium]